MKVRALQGGRFVAVDLDWDFIRKWWDAGATVWRIAAAVGLSKSHMSRVLSAQGMRRLRGWRPVGWRRPGVAPVIPPRPIVGGMSEAEAIAQFLEQRGITHCEPGFAAPTQAARS